MDSPFYVTPLADGQDCSIIDTSNSIVNNPDIQFKVVIVGDSGCGKTSLFSSYILGSFPVAYEPTIFENHRVFIKNKSDNKVFSADLWDTAGQEEYERLRRLSYQDADIVIIAYSFESQTTLSNITEVWAPETMTYAPDAPIVLVGLKSDIENSNINTNVAHKIAESIGAVAHIDCSSLHMYNVNELFNAVFNTAYNSYKIKQRQSISAPPPQSLSTPKNKRNSLVSLKKSTTNSKSKKNKKKSKCIIL